VLRSGGESNDAMAVGGGEALKADEAGYRDVISLGAGAKIGRRCGIRGAHVTIPLCDRLVSNKKV
jgi:hypothetical protein